MRAWSRALRTQYGAVSSRPSPETSARITKASPVVIAVVSPVSSTLRLRFMARRRQTGDEAHRRNLGNARRIRAAPRVAEEVAHECARGLVVHIPAGGVTRRVSGQANSSGPLRARDRSAATPNTEFRNSRVAHARRWPYAVSWSRAKGKDPRAADVGATMICLSDREARSPRRVHRGCLRASCFPDKKVALSGDRARSGSALDESRGRRPGLELSHTERRGHATLGRRGGRTVG